MSRVAGVAVQHQINGSLFPVHSRAAIADRFQGMPSIELRWDNRGNIVPTVKVLAIIALPHTRYVWDGNPQRYLMVSWYELDSDYARYSRVAKASVKLL